MPDDGHLGRRRAAARGRPTVRCVAGGTGRAPLRHMTCAFVQHPAAQHGTTVPVASETRHPRDPSVITTEGMPLRRSPSAVASAVETDAALLPEGGSRKTKALLQPKALNRMLRRFEDVWIKDVLNLPPRVSRRLGSLRVLKRPHTT